jgi:hypothetical protein
MAYIGHRCPCGHTDLQHTQTGEDGNLGHCTADFGSTGCGPAAQPR